MARSRKRHSPTDEEWEQRIAAYKVADALDHEEFRLRLGELARTLEREALHLHRLADRDEHRCSYYSWKVRPSGTSTSILKRLRDKFAQTPDGTSKTSAYLQFIEPYLKRLRGPDMRPSAAELRACASALLDASEYIDDQLHEHEDQVRQLRVDPIGARPKVALAIATTVIDEWDVGPMEVAGRLVDAGVQVEFVSDGQTPKRQLARRFAAAMGRRRRAR